MTGRLKHLKIPVTSTLLLGIGHGRSRLLHPSLLGLNSRCYGLNELQDYLRYSSYLRLHLRRLRQVMIPFPALNSAAFNISSLFVFLAHVERLTVSASTTTARTLLVVLITSTVLVVCNNLSPVNTCRPHLYSLAPTTSSPSELRRPPIL